MSREWDAEADEDARERYRVEWRRVVRHFHRYTPEQRANHAASHRLGPRQRKADGEYFYVHPDLPHKAFPTRQAAARAAVDRVPPVDLDHRDDKTQEQG